MSYEVYYKTSRQDRSYDYEDADLYGYDPVNEEERRGDALADELIGDMHYVYEALGARAFNKLMAEL